ncbi:MAG: hypothetical protein OXI01_00250 [Albidovulum sp.]|nr:hypothetical protein [Albidovulum sp.]
MAAETARRSHNLIGEGHRALLARKDKPVATAATARELARLIYLMAARAEDCFEREMQAFERIRAARTVAILYRSVKRHGYLLVRIAEVRDGEKARNQRVEGSLLKRAMLNSCFDGFRYACRIEGTDRRSIIQFAGSWESRGGAACLPDTVRNFIQRTSKVVPIPSFRNACGRQSFMQQLWRWQ